MKMAVPLYLHTRVRRLWRCTSQIFGMFQCTWRLKKTAKSARNCFMIRKGGFVIRGNYWMDYTLRVKINDIWRFDQRCRKRRKR